MNMKKNIKN